jgi:hypothetical protein
MKLTPFVYGVFIYFLSALCPVYAHTYSISGFIDTTNGITGINAWNSGITNLTWNVNHTDEFFGSGIYKTIYSYSFTHPGSSTYNFILELHPNMLFDDFSSILDVNSTLPNYEKGIFSSTDPLTGLPDTITGIRFWGDTGSASETITFTSGYEPMWGDFYASDRLLETAVWNQGFTAQDNDPSDHVGEAINGSVDSHILVPGRDGAPTIPIPAALWLYASGLLGLFGAGYKRRSS